MAPYDLVTVVEDLPDHGITAGAVGVIVEIHTSPDLAYEVEFVEPDGSGRTKALLALRPEQIRPADRTTP